MDQVSQWLHEEALAQADRADDYAERAFYVSLASFIAAQTLRIEQAQGEVDGRLWNHEQW